MNNELDNQTTSLFPDTLPNDPYFNLQAFDNRMMNEHRMDYLLNDSMPAQVIRGAADVAERFVKAPRQTLDGTLDPRSDEAIQTMFDGAGLLALQAPFTAVDNAAGIFGGRLSQNFPEKQLRIALDMEKKGATPEQIYDTTGLWKGLEGQYRYEMDLSQPKLIGRASGNNTLSQIIDFPELFEAYPQLRDFPVRQVYRPGNDTSGAIAYAGNDHIGLIAGRMPEREQEYLSVLLHEAQHLVQNIELFSRGASTSSSPNLTDSIVKTARDWISSEEGMRAAQMRQAYIDEMTRRTRKIGPVDSNGNARRDPITGQIMQWKHDFRYYFPEEAAKLDFYSSVVRRPKWHDDEGYRLAGGEAEARNVEKRYDMAQRMSQEDMRQYPPFMTLDRPESELYEPSGSSVLITGEDYDQYLSRIRRRKVPNYTPAPSRERPNMSDYVTDTVQQTNMPPELPVTNNTDSIRAFHSGPFSFNWFDFNRLEKLEGVTSPEANFNHGYGIHFTSDRDLSRAYRLPGEGESDMYEVDLNAPVESFLDWDVPIRQQNENVRNWTRSVMGGVPSRMTTEEVLNRANRKFDDGSNIGRLSPGLSKSLRESGIPGITFVSDGARNYIVFDDSIIKILSRYKVAGLGALPAGVLAGMGLTQEQAEELDANRVM